MNMDSLHDHYYQPDLTDRILAALREAEVDTDRLTRDDLDLLDEFHIRGRAATVELAALADLKAEHAVLDLGCRIGGPARLLAGQYGCRVTGLDLVEAYCEAATELTRRVGLADRVDFKQGDMRKMPFADDSFDRVWSQHTIMNIPDKAALAAEMCRILRPGGKVVFYEVCTGNGDAVDLPVPWASEPQHSYLVTPDELRSVMAASGLQEEVWADVTRKALAWLNNMVADMKTSTPKGPRRPGLGLLMGADAGKKSQNMGRNLKDGRIVVVQGVFNRLCPEECRSEKRLKF